jgi:phosphoribosyl-ATP pyrophosphohydrolase/phosphoribosyl-AMP cyclohydrolase
VSPAPTIRSLDDLRWDERGLLPAIVQDAHSGRVLTLAWMNRESLRRSLETGQTWFWSRSRSELWHKGETSGNTQQIREFAIDCDQDAILVQVEPSGPACHSGAESCFFESLEGAPGAADSGTAAPAAVPELGAILAGLRTLVAQRHAERPPGSYTTSLFDAGLDRIAQKVGEEAVEVVIAAKNDDDAILASELADLLFHVVVLMEARGLPASALAATLQARRGRKPGEPK